MTKREEFAKVRRELLKRLGRKTPNDSRNEPPCYLPEQNNPYPLCVGRGMAVCAHCCIWADYEPEENESRVNRALTMSELKQMDGEPVYVMDGEGHECYCVVNTKNEDCIDNEAGAWCFEFYDMTGDGKHGLHKMGWLAYRRKPERSE